MLPLVRVETNVARALARAAAETRSALVVMGWDGSPAAARALFGGITDRVLAETTASVLIARETRPASTVRRLVVAVPPGAEHEPGFVSGVRTLSALAARVGAPLVLVTTEAARATVAPAFGRKGRPAETVALGPLARPRRRRRRAPPARDALALLSARPGAASWRASLDRLPRALAHGSRPLAPRALPRPRPAAGPGGLPQP